MPEHSFSYDLGYRPIAATGREHDGLAQPHFAWPEVHMSLRSAPGEITKQELDAIDDETKWVGEYNEAHPGDLPLRRRHPRIHQMSLFTRATQRHTGMTLALLSVACHISPRLAEEHIAFGTYVDIQEIRPCPTEHTSSPIGCAEVLFSIVNKGTAAVFIPTPPPYAEFVVPPYRSGIRIAHQIRTGSWREHAPEVPLIPLPPGHHINAVSSIRAALSRDIGSPDADPEFRVSVAMIPESATRPFAADKPIAAAPGPWAQLHQRTVESRDIRIPAPMIPLLRDIDISITTTFFDDATRRIGQSTSQNTEPRPTIEFSLPDHGKVGHSTPPQEKF
ncbi:MAG: hypothetical protein H6711_04180 [Myxococcales bacterium]|nr:hypothetical protein [Myxococcales bacterium]